MTKTKFTTFSKNVSLEHCLQCHKAAIVLKYPICEARDTPLAIMNIGNGKIVVSRPRGYSTLFLVIIEKRSCSYSSLCFYVVVLKQDCFCEPCDCIIIIYFSSLSRITHCYFFPSFPLIYPYIQVSMIILNFRLKISNL